MPNKASAAKAMRQSAKRRDRNRSARSAFRTVMKKSITALDEGTVTDDLATQLQAALKVIGKTEKKGLIHKNKAARHQSSLMKKYNALVNPPAAEKA